MSEPEKSHKAEKAAEERFFTGPLLIIYLTVFIDLIGFGMVIPILPFYANTDHLTRRPLRSGFCSEFIP